MASETGDGSKLPRHARLPGQSAFAPGSLITLSPFRGLQPDVGAEFFRRAADQFGAQRNKAFLDLRLTKYAHDFRVQPADDHFRRACRGEQPYPTDRFETGVSGL